MSPKHIILFALTFLLLLLVITLPLWWEHMSPGIFGFPSYLSREINAYIDAVKWLVDSIWCWMYDCIS